MSRSKMTGMVQTVLGPVPASELGITLMHEHILADVTCLFEEPSDPAERDLAYQPLSLQNLDWVRRHYTSSLDNLKFQDEDVAVDEVMLFKQAGGNTVVDGTNWDLGRDPQALQRIARRTGLNIIMGTGTYVTSSRFPGENTGSEEDIAGAMVRDIAEGAGNTGVRAGIIGEIGCSWPLTEGERKSLRAAAKAQQITGALLMVHPGRNERAPQEMVEILRELGADLSRTVMMHIDRTISDLDTLFELASSGCCIEYDMFGEEASFYPQNPDMDLPNDAMRVDYIKRLVEAGYLGQLVVSHDVAFKFKQVRYGGPGFAHILKYVVPVMRRKGFTEEQIQAILVDNPGRLLQFA